MIIFLLIILTEIIWIITYIPLFLISLFLVPIMLVFFKWEGYKSWFGNRKYGKYGNKSHPSKTLLDEILFLTIINPISNFGQEVMSVTPKKPIELIAGRTDITDGEEKIEGYYFLISEWYFKIPIWEIRIVKSTFPGKCFEGRFGWKLNGKTFPTDGKCTFVARFNPFKKFG